ncbi:unnamed protein product [Brassicogethes aeneus]|uniref:Dynein axonemal assembly factor 1 homolog n=1 Tax=Brassicogethes aeneus TaxID=1431903 RepID=A0A9P0BKX5_BRAAE|nr:unnamed protein product [Brassicogethes aeneus]
MSTMSSSSSDSEENSTECEDFYVDKDYEECVELSKEWGVHLADECLWASDKKPFTVYRDKKKIELDEYEEQGFLSDRLLACCTTYFDKSPEVQHYALCKCDLSHLKILTDITILKYHHYIQYLDLSKNKIEELGALGNLPFLMYLNASHNNIINLLDFKAPLNLTYADFSHNLIEVIEDLSEFWSLKTLNVSYNKIRQINGLLDLKYLRVLDLSHNYITELNNVENLRLRELYLSENCIQTCQNIVCTLQFIRIIDLSRNNIRTLEFLKGVENLEELYISGNYIEYILELSNFEALKFVTKVNMKGNPIVLNKHYFSLCIKFIPNLYVLNDEYLTSSLKEYALSSDNRILNVGVKRANLALINGLNQHNTTTAVLPLGETRPILILVGLPGSGVKNFASRICEKYSKEKDIHIRYDPEAIVEKKLKELKKTESEIRGIIINIIEDSLDSASRPKRAKKKKSKLNQGSSRDDSKHSSWEPTKSEDCSKFDSLCESTCKIRTSIPEKQSLVPSSASEAVIDGNVVLSSLSIEQEMDEECLQKLESKVSDFFHRILLERDELLAIHCANIGLFHDLFFTDDLDSSLEKMRKFVKQIVTQQSNKEPVDIFKDDKSHENIIKAKLKAFRSDLDIPAKDMKRTILSTTGHSKYCLQKHNLGK